MSKELNLGALKVNIPDYTNSHIGKAIELIQNDYEAGNLRAMFVVWASKDGVSRAIVGDQLVMPGVLMHASIVAGAALDNIEDVILGQDGDDD